ncbi:hypothetical protein AMECASPLE_039034 [Ameca splendens]|uniref:Uncharacterized protein n=1 Tax=Ameca splendens TaxID=208324 RepID=A0ABV0ZT85_9TELE
MLANIAKAVEFNAEEIKDCQTRLRSIENEVTTPKKGSTSLVERILERFKQRLNLKIHGLKEKDGEDIREEVRNLLVKISPRLGPKHQSYCGFSAPSWQTCGKSNQTSHHPIHPKIGWLLKIPNLHNNRTSFFFFTGKELFLNCFTC